MQGTYGLYVIPVHFIWNFLLHEEHHIISTLFSISFLISKYVIIHPVGDKNDKSKDSPHFWQQWLGIPDGKPEELLIPFSIINDDLIIGWGRERGRERGGERGRERLSRRGIETEEWVEKGRERERERGRERGRGWGREMESEEGAGSVSGKGGKRETGRGRERGRGTGEEDSGKEELVSIDKLTFSSISTFSILFISWREIRSFCFSTAICKKENKSDFSENLLKIL